jgi:hypothetical protein
MRILILTLVFVTSLAAQRGGRMGGGFHGSPARGVGGGGYVHRPSGGYYVGSGGYYRGGGGYYRGYSGYYHHGYPGFRYPGYGYYRRSFYPYYPYFGFGVGFGYYPYGGYYGGGLYSVASNYYPPYYDYGYPGGSGGVTVVTSPGASDTTPSAIIINNTGRERYQTRTESQSAESTAQPTEQRQSETRATRSPVYLIALNTGIIWMAVAYWSEGGDLHFITTKNERKQIPFSQLDRSLTEQLNRERNVTFHLP